MNRENSGSGKLEKLTANANELRYQRGNRDGCAGLNPSSTSQEYWQGYIAGRRTSAEQKLRHY